MLEDAMARLGNGARLALAGIRLFNGVAALAAPQVAARRIGGVPYPHPETLYALRLFGIRTILLAGDLVARDEAVRRRAVRLALVIHLTDTASAALAGARGDVPARTARTLTAISATNALLAALARRS
jgi:hypothetical protein